MTEGQLRTKVADNIVEYLGCNEYDGSHRSIIDLYNQIRPLPRGYKMSYTDPWCAAFISAVAQEMGMTDIIYPECGCDAMINLYKAKGRWREADDYSPSVGDIIFYDWQDSGYGDNTGSSDHVGFVYARSGNSMTIIEGNISDSVDFRTLNENGRYIRGYGLPNYSAKAAAMNGESVESEEASEPEPKSGMRTLTEGMVGNDVGVLQALLEYYGAEYGFDCGKYGIDKDFGEDTKAALIKYQGIKGLEADGVCGKDTWNKLKDF